MTITSFLQTFFDGYFIKDDVKYINGQNRIIIMLTQVNI